MLFESEMPPGKKKKEKKKLKTEKVINLKPSETGKKKITSKVTVLLLSMTEADNNKKFKKIKNNNKLKFRISQENLSETVKT